MDTIPTAEAVREPSSRPGIADLDAASIFLSGGILGCICRRNYPISQMGTGKVVTIAWLIGLMRGPANPGVHNVTNVRSMGRHFPAHRAVGDPVVGWPMQPATGPEDRTAPWRWAGIVRQ